MSKLSKSRSCDFFEQLVAAFYDEDDKYKVDELRNLISEKLNSLEQNTTPEPPQKKLNLSEQTSDQIYTTTPLSTDDLLDLEVAEIIGNYKSNGSV